MNKLSKDFYCKICERYYKSYQSLWNHNKRYHSDIPKIPPNPAKIPPEPAKNRQNLQFSDNNIIKINDSIEVNDDNLTCKLCKKKFKRNDYLTKHIKLNRCKVKKSNDILLNNKYNDLKSKHESLIVKYSEEIDVLKKQVENLINTKGKIHYKTLQKINKQNITNNINNTQNNINIIGFTKENINDIFSAKEKANILKKKYNSINQIIETTHFNDKYPQFKNIKITNLNNNIAYKYDDNKKTFMATTKDELITDLVLNRMCDIDDFRNDDNVNKLLSEKDKEIVCKMLEKFYDDEYKYVDNKMEHFNIFIYNCSKE